MKAIWLILWCSWSLYANDPTQFFSANQKYDEGDYETAIKLYEQLALESSDESGALFYNLGSSYFRQGNLGKAIYYYRKAQQLKPRDPDISYNLNYAKEQAKDKVEAKLSLTDRLVAMVPISRKESIWSAIVLLGLFWVSGLVLLFQQKEWLRWVRVTLGVCAVLSVGALGIRTYGVKPFGVVADSEAKVYSGVGRNNLALFTLHEGTEFTVRQMASLNEASWVQIELADGKKGWLAKSQVLLSEKE